MIYTCPTVLSTLNPKWDFYCEFPLTESEAREGEVEIEVFDADLCQVGHSIKKPLESQLRIHYITFQDDDPIGYTSVSIGHAIAVSPPSSSFESWYSLAGSDFHSGIRIRADFARLQNPTKVVPTPNENTSVGHAVLVRMCYNLTFGLAYLNIVHSP